MDKDGLRQQQATKGSAASAFSYLQFMSYALAIEKWDLAASSSSVHPTLSHVIFLTYQTMEKARPIHIRWGGRK